MFDNKKVIIFDLDGTLIDSPWVWDITDQELIKHYTNKLVSLDTIRKERDYVLSHAGSSNIYECYIEYLKNKYGITESISDILSYRKNISNWNIKEKVKLKKGAVELLTFLKEKGFILALATTTNRECVNIYSDINPHTSILDFNNIFDLILTAEDVKNKKPNPEVHQKIMDYFKVKASECLIFEDTIFGVEAGHNVNIEVVGVVDTNSLEALEVKKNADYFMKSLEEVCILEKFM